MLIMRSEQPLQYRAIHRIIETAYGGGSQADRVDALRKSPDYLKGMSIVAQEEKTPVGHILFTRVFLESGEERYPIVALQSLAVEPDFQGKNIGRQLVRYGLQKCERRGHLVVVVQGCSRYYQQLGFEPAAHYGIGLSATQKEEELMIWTVDPGRLVGVTGQVHGLSE